MPTPYDSRIEELQDELDQLKSNTVTKQALEEVLAGVENSKFYMSRFMEPEQKDEMKILVEDMIMDVVWGKYFYIFELLGSTDNYTVGGSTLTPALASDVITNTVADDYAYVIREMAIGETFSHERDARFRVNVNWTSGVVTGPVDNQISYIKTLDDATAIPGISGDKVSSTGFKAVNGELFGLNQFGGVEATIKLKNIVYGTNYICELRYYPRDRVDFYVDNVLLGSLSEFLPASSNNGLGILSLYTQTTDATQKWMDVEYFEFMQQRAK